jgi:hypothetical protein
MLLAILCGDPRTTVNSNADGQLSAVRDVRQLLNNRLNNTTSLYHELFYKKYQRASTCTL